jgi:predicted site-specific integrase-resolvase
MRVGAYATPRVRSRGGSELIVVNGDSLSPEQELVKDLVASISVFAARVHGLRSYKKVLKDAAVQKDQT